MKMTIKEIRAALIGKFLHRNDSWYGHSTFVVKAVKVKGNTIHCYAKEDASDLPEYLYTEELPVLVEKGKFERRPHVCDGCIVTRSYRLSKGSQQHHNQQYLINFQL